MAKTKEEETLQALADVFKNAAKFVDENKEELIVVLSFIKTVEILGKSNDEKNEL